MLSEHRILSIDRLNDSHKEPFKNIWLGTSVEDNKVLHRIDELGQVPSAIRFISFISLIGSVGELDLTDINWTLVGGESGKNARVGS